MHEADLETLLGLVSQYSPSGQERNAVEWLVTRMDRLGYDNAFVDNAGNAVGVRGNGPRQVVLLGHIDTVPGEIPVRVEKGKAIDESAVLYGRGSGDAKGPLACFVDAVAKLGERDGWQFVVIGAVEEERESDGARFAVSQYKPDYAIVGEPNQWDRIALGYKGSAWATAAVRRTQAHTASGEQTAAEAAVDAWLKIRAYVDSFNLSRQRNFDKLLLTLRAIESDSNDFEQWAQLNVGVRLPIEVSPPDWYRVLGEMAGDSSSGSDAQVTVTPTGYAVPAWECEKNTLLVRALLSGIRSEGGTPRFVYKTGTADLNIVAPIWKCPAVVYGPGDSAFDHTPNEHLALDDYTKSVQVLFHALGNLVTKT